MSLSLSPSILLINAHIHAHACTHTHPPAGINGAVEPGRILSVLRPALRWNCRYIKNGQAVVDVAFHVHLMLRVVGVHVHESRDHVRGEGHNKCLCNHKVNLWVKQPYKHITSRRWEWCCTLTFVTTERTAIPLRISSQAPILWALDATGRLNWVVSFQESTLISMMLLIRASRGARGKEATNSVIKPNWITGTQRAMASQNQYQGNSTIYRISGTHTAY